MSRLILLLFFPMLIYSCTDHVEEIAECKQCDTLINLNVTFEDTASVSVGDTIIYILQKAPRFLPIKRYAILLSRHKKFQINDTIHRSDTLTINIHGTTHRYYGFIKDWYAMPNMFDNTDGACGLHDYFIDGIEIRESGKVLQIPK